MTETRDAMLTFLKKRGEARAEELAAELGVTVSAVRQHLTGLAAEGLVSHARCEPGGGGRSTCNRLTAAAESLFRRRTAS